MKLIRPNGSVAEIHEGYPVIIKRTVVNGKIIRKVYRSDNLTDDINGYIFTTGVLTCNTLIGNVSVDTVKEIIDMVTENGVINLSKLGNLKHPTTYKKLLAETEPYYINWSTCREPNGNRLSGRLDNLSNKASNMDTIFGYNPANVAALSEEEEEYEEEFE